jgi:hypothetical protein
MQRYPKEFENISAPGIQLIRFDLTVHFQHWEGMFDGKMTDDGAPVSKLSV